MQLASPRDGQRHAHLVSQQHVWHESPTRKHAQIHPTASRPEAHDTAVGARYPHPTTPHPTPPITCDPRKRLSTSTAKLSAPQRGKQWDAKKMRSYSHRDSVAKMTMQRLVRRTCVQFPIHPMHALLQADPPACECAKMLKGRGRAGLRSVEGGARGSTHPTPTCEGVRSGSGRSEARRRRCP